MLLGKYQSLTSDIKNIKSTLVDSVKLHGLTIDKNINFDNCVMFCAVW